MRLLKALALSSIAVAAILIGSFILATSAKLFGIWGLLGCVFFVLSVIAYFELGEQ